MFAPISPLHLSCLFLLSIFTPPCLCLLGRRGWEVQFAPLRGDCWNLPELEAAGAEMSPPIWQQKRKLSVKLHFHQSVRGVELLLPRKGLEMGA